MEVGSAPHVELPLRYLRQSAHYTTPASSYEMAVKAVRNGFAPTERLLGRHDISWRDLSAALGTTVEAVEALAAGDYRAPLVLLDGEDAQVHDADSVELGREVVARVFREESRGSSLGFYRPRGIGDGGEEDLAAVLEAAATGAPPESFPIDGVVLPKVERADEIERVDALLGQVEGRFGLPANGIRLQLLVESGWAVANLPEIARRAVPRLTGIIFGSADYAADVGLTEMPNDHPLFDWARAQVVNVAGAVGVPAIDGMTFGYPVADPTRSPGENRVRILARLRQCYEDALHAMALGMRGKWAGHPAQVFVVMLAFAGRLSRAAIAADVGKLRAYHAAVEQRRGATIIDGAMADRATDRHVRMRLREAVALGLITGVEGVELGVVTAAEVRTPEL